MRRAGCRGHRPIRHRHSRAVVADLAPERGRRTTVILGFAIGTMHFVCDPLEKRVAELEAQVRARQLRHRGRQHVALRAGK